MTDQQDFRARLPELPKPAWPSPVARQPYYTADQMRAYAAATLAKTQEGVTDILRSRPCCPAGSANCDIEVEKLVSLFAQQKAPEGEEECETCEGRGWHDERLGGYSFSNPKAPCPDCDGTGQLSDSAAPGGDVEQRAHFERWVSKRWGCSTEKWADSGEYQYHMTRDWWQCWQAALSAPKQVGVVPDDMENAVKTAGAAVEKKADELELVSGVAYDREISEALAHVAITAALPLLRSQLADVHRSARLPRAWESSGDTVPVVIAHEVKALLNAAGSPLAKLFTTPLYTSPQAAPVPVEEWQPTPCPVCAGFCGDKGPTCEERLAQPVPVEGEVFGWWFKHPNGIGCFVERPSATTIANYQTTEGYTATPLYATPPPSQPAPAEGEGPIAFVRWLDEGFEIDWLRNHTNGDCYLYTTPPPSQPAVDWSAALEKATDRIVASRAEQPAVELWRFVERAFDSSKTSTSERLLECLGLPSDDAQMPLSWHINRALALLDGAKAGRS